VLTIRGASTVPGPKYAAPSAEALNHAIGYFRNKGEVGFKRLHNAQVFVYMTSDLDHEHWLQLSRELVVDIGFPRPREKLSRRVINSGIRILRAASKAVLFGGGEFTIVGDIGAWGSVRRISRRARRAEPSTTALLPLSFAFLCGGDPK
jgi:hypothetical protein